MLLQKIIAFFDGPELFTAAMCIWVVPFCQVVKAALYHYLGQLVDIDNAECCHVPFDKEFRWTQMPHLSNN